MQAVDFAAMYEVRPQSSGHLCMNTFSERLKMRRDERGITQAELSKTLGIPTSQYNRYEKGGSNPKREHLVALAVALECTTDWLLGLVDNPGESREFDSLPEDERNLVVLYRQFKRDKKISRLQQSLLRDLNITDENLIPPPKAKDDGETPGKQEPPDEKPL